MLRALSIFGLGILFLMISPVLRIHVASLILGLVDVIDKYSPYSYMLAALGVFAVFTIAMNRGAQPR